MKFSKGKYLTRKFLLVGLYLVLVAIFWVFKLPCVYQFFLHIPCWGCGMTRALVSAIHLDFVSAFQYHYAFWSIPILLLYYFADGGIFKRKAANVAVIGFIAVVFVINWMRNLIPVLLSFCV